jgi:hypothetical protein
LLSDDDDTAPENIGPTQPAGLAAAQPFSRGLQPVA